MKKKILVIAGVILVLILIIVFATQQPIIETAKTLSKAESLSRFNFNVELNIDENRLSDKQLDFVNNISSMLGVESSSMLKLKLEGSLYDDTAYAVISNEAVGSQITKVYIHGDEAYINVKMIYDLITSRLIERYPLLDYLIPDWSYGEYITTSQLETIFDVDFEELFTIKTQEFIKDPSFIECLIGLFSLDKVKNDDGSTEYNTDWKNYDISFTIDEANDAPIAYFSAESNSRNNAIESFNGEVSFDSVEAISIPGSTVSQDTVDGFAKIWSVLVELLDKIKQWG